MRVGHVGDCGSWFAQSVSRHANLVCSLVAIGLWVIVGYGFLATHNNPQHGAKAWGHKSVGHVGSRGRRFKFV